MSSGTTWDDRWLNSFDFHPDSGTYRAGFDPETTTASAAVIGAISEVTASAPTDCEPLYDAVDPDALDALVRRQSSGTVQVSFTFEGRRVTVESHGEVAIDSLPAAHDDDPSERGQAE